jgi:hypothetical protein
LLDPPDANSPPSSRDLLDLLLSGVLPSLSESPGSLFIAISVLVLLFSESKCNASGLYAEYPLLTEPELNSNRRGCIPSSLAMNDGVGISPSSRLFKYLIPVIFFLPPSQPLINVSYFLHLITIGNSTIFLLKITALPIQNLSGHNFEFKLSRT